MKLLQIGGFRGYKPWFDSVEKCADAYRGIAITGDMLNTTLPREREHPQCLRLRDWIRRLQVPVFYARGWYDPDGMDDWFDVPNLCLAGDHFMFGWRIHVRNTFVSGNQIEPNPTQTIIVSHFPPAGTLTGISPCGEHHGVLAIRIDAETARLVLCGHVVDPRATTDWCEGSFVVNPGLALRERDTDPYHAAFDCDRRQVRVRGVTGFTSHSFAR
jgi:hypothetical protein